MNKQNICFTTLKKECAERGLDPASIPAFKHTLTDKALAHKQAQHVSFIQAITHFFNKFISSLSGIPILAAANDRDGYVLHMIGDSAIKETIMKLGIRNGVQMTAEYNGINSSCLALEYGDPVSVIGSQHFHEYLHDAACYSIPISDPHESEFLGTLSFMTAADFAHPLLETLLMTMKESIERELKLLKQNERLRLLNELIMDTTTSGMIISDKDGSILNANKALEQIFNKSKPELLGKNIRDFPCVGPYMDHALKSGVPHLDIEAAFTNEKGQQSFYLLDALPIFDDTHTLVGSFAQLRNITTRKQTEQMLLNTEKLAAVGQMAASAAHEIRNPLTTIRGFIQLLEPSFHQQEHYDLVLEEIDRINLIISEFLILSKPQATCFEQQNLVQILKDTVALSQPQASMHNVQIHIDFHADPVFIHGDGSQLKQVFINLIKNGMDAIESHGVLSIHLKANEQGEAVIKMTDTGIGMTETQIQKLGTPFFTTKKDGTGLGFMIIKRIVNQHNGKIEVKSKEGEGSTITVRLPLSE